MASFEGRALLSAEADEDRPLAFDWLVSDDPGAFLRFIRPLPPRERDTMIGYFMLRVDQQRLAAILALSQQSRVAATLKRARARLSGDKLNRTKAKPRETETIVCPAHLGEFRVSVEFAGDIFAASSTVRSGESADYGSDRF